MDASTETITPEQALLASLLAVNQLVVACDESTEFKRREIYATERLRRTAGDIGEHIERLPAENRLNWILNAGKNWIAAVRLARQDLGAPGDFGYEQPEGAAMRQLYNSADTLAQVIKAAGGVP